MKTYSKLNLVTVFIVSFMAWIYCIAVAVLGLIYNAYPGQDGVSVLIATLPTVFTMITAFAATVLFRIISRKWITIASMVVAFIAGAAIFFIDMPIWGVVICSAILGIPAGIIPGANASVLPVIAPENLKDKVAGWHTGLMMLGMAAFTFLAGVFAGESFQGAYATIFVLIPAIILSIFFYPDIDKDMKNSMIKDTTANSEETIKSADTVHKGKMPPITIIAPLMYFIGCIFWNAWYMNYSDLIINDLQIGGAALSGTIGSLGSVGGCIAGFVVAYWIKATKSWSMPLAFVLTGLCFVIPVVMPNTAGCYFAGFANQFFNIFIVSGLTTYGALGTAGSKYATICMPLISVAEGGGVFVCGYLLPVLGNMLFGGGARANLLAACIIMVVIGIVSVFVMRPIHKQIYGKETEQTAA